MIYHSLLDFIGNTPLLSLDRFSQHLGLQTQIVAKLEGRNPGGSAKDRVGKAMIEDAERRGALRPGSVIIEPTSGNTGVGLALAARLRGYRVILTMPETMSIERRRLLTAYGAELVLTEGAKGMAGAIARAEKLAQEIPDSFIPGQFSNPANPAAHFEATGPEIWRDTDGKAAAFVAGAGTGGTVSGVGKYLKAQDTGIWIAAVEPSESAVLSGGKAGPHAIQGIGAGFVPEIYDPSVVDEVLTVSGADASAMARTLAETEGLLSGISAGAALCAAVSLAKRPQFFEKMIVVLLPDGGERYLSTGLFSQD